MPMLSQAIGRVVPLASLGGCCLMLAVTVGCLRPTMQSETINVVRQPELVAHCTLKMEGTYTAVGENNALTLAKNAAAEKGGNVLLLTSITKRDTFTTEVHGQIYACPRTR
jgi:hypothetical protein